MTSQYNFAKDTEIILDFLLLFFLNLKLYFQVLKHENVFFFLIPNHRKTSYKVSTVVALKGKNPSVNVDVQSGLMVNVFNGSNKLLSALILTEKAEFSCCKTGSSCIP